MLTINDSVYGSITINNLKYNFDVYILVSEIIEERESSHTITKEEIEHVLKGNPNVIVIGKGTSGVAELNEEAKKFVKSLDIEIIIDDTPKIRDKFNEKAKTKKVAAIIHTTC
jgi:hypothetical protein